ncbi:hypothetical protein RhiJN_03176 [Ceratobasidium sp. AG-Ba]|nr:hypothetical protein RhiJN_03176 [Ceratobasidium sp. AG-Ba]
MKASSVFESLARPGNVGHLGPFLRDSIELTAGASLPNAARMAYFRKRRATERDAQRKPIGGPLAPGRPVPIARNDPASRHDIDGREKPSAVRIAPNCELPGQDSTDGQPLPRS